VAVTITSVTFTTVMMSVGRSVAENADVVNRTVAVELARDLMEEISTRRFLDPDPAAGFGIEPDEVTEPQQRLTFDDLDDYQGWHSGPPQKSDGTSLGSGGETDGADTFGDYTRDVVVEYVSDTDCRTSVSPGQSYFVRVTVRVAHKGQAVYELQKLFAYDEQY